MRFNIVKNKERLGKTTTMVDYDEQNKNHCKELMIMDFDEDGNLLYMMGIDTCIDVHSNDETRKDN